MLSIPSHWTWGLTCPLCGAAGWPPGSSDSPETVHPDYLARSFMVPGWGGGHLGRLSLVVFFQMHRFIRTKCPPQCKHSRVRPSLSASGPGMAGRWRQPSPGFYGAASSGSPAPGHPLGNGHQALCLFSVGLAASRNPRCQGSTLNPRKSLSDGFPPDSVICGLGTLSQHL